MTTTEIKKRTIRLSDDLWHQLDIEASKEGKSKSVKIRELVEQYLSFNKEEIKPCDNYKDMVLTRSFNNNIYYRAIQYISRYTGVPLEEIKNYCINEIGLIIKDEPL